MRSLALPSTDRPLAAAAALLLLSGCLSPLPTFRCADDSQCSYRGQHGICVRPDQLCALPSNACVSGYAFDHTAGALAGQCVGTDDGGVPDDMAMGSGMPAGSKSLGSTCADGSECDSGFCVDKVCCQSKCDGQCQQCVAGSGQCQPVTTGQPVGGRPVCTGAGSAPCGGSCTIADSLHCTYPDTTTVCRSASCTNGIAVTAANCDGAGTCPLVTKACAPYVCDATTCKTSCTGTPDCVGGDQCASLMCSPINPRLIYPLSTATVTSRRPMLHWELPVGATGIAVDVCATRACSSTIATVTVDGTGTNGAPTTDLPKGIVFWRVRATVGSSTNFSSTWEFNVGAQSAPTNRSWGTILDVNGDGYADLAVAAPNVGSGNGKVYVFQGGAAGLSTTPNTTITGSGGNFGAAVASAGDVNGDGYADLIVGAPASNTGSGAAYVYLGSASGLGAGPSAASILLAPSSGSGLGTSVSSAGDVDGDGYGDVIVGAPTAPVPGQPSSFKGAAYVYRGSLSGLGSQPTPTFSLSMSTGGNFGTTVAAGDIDADGYSEVVVSATFAPYSIVNGSGPGAVYVFRGSNNGPGALPWLTLNAIYTADHFFGNAVASSLDVNGDGYSEIVVAHDVVSSGGVNRNGAVYVYAGGTSPSNTPASGWGTINGPAVDQNLFGAWVASAADLNGDGYDELAVGTNNANAGGVYVFAGGSGGLGSTYTTPNNPAGAASGWGATVGGAGDVDGNGYPDLFAGAYCTMPSGGMCGGAGAVYVYEGSASGIANNQSPATGWGTLTSTDGANARFGTAAY